MARIQKLARITSLVALMIGCGGDEAPDDPIPDAAVGGLEGGREAGSRREGGSAAQPPCTMRGDEICNGRDDDCDGSIDEGYLLACAPCADGDDPACVDATLAGGGWRHGIARNLLVGSDRGIALPRLPGRNEFLWVANSSENTVSKVRISDGREVGRFLVGDNPSRTGVDGNGDAWIAMRGSVGDDGTGPREGVVKIAGDCTPRVQPPAATRECILLDIPDVGNLLRGVAIDARGDVWIASYATRELIRLDSDTGVERQRVTLDPSAAPYGVAVDENGFIWVACATGDATVLRVDPTLGAVDLALTRAETGGLTPYGLAPDGEGGMWFGSNSTSVFRVDTTTGEFGPTFRAPGATTRGVAVDDEGALWAADSGRDLLVRFDRSTGAIMAEVMVGTSPVGVAIDHDGNIWSANQTSDDVTKVAPNGDVFGSYPVGDFPYTYSDMTGSAFRIFRTLRGRFTGSFDVGVPGARWTGVRWEGEVTRPAELALRARAADREPSLDAAAWSDVELDGNRGTFDARGAWLEVEVTLASTDRDAEAFIERLVFTFTE